MNLKLSPTEILHHEELIADSRAINQTATMAMNFCANRYSELDKKRKEFWDNLYISHGLDYSKDYQITSNGPMVELTEMEPKTK